ncbi:MAG: hypothetical protein IJF18_08010 [Oscillospiraceae bacterium]|nr:hypothetical protein [Oscillospiraceae bacterium]
MATFFNQATLSYNGNVTNSNITTGEILEALSAVKTPVDDEYWFNEENTYVISITNSGTASYTNLTLTDDLGEYSFGTGTLVPLTYVENSVLYYVNGVLQPAPAVTAGNELTISGINVPAGGNAIILYAVTANGYAPLDGNSSITNTVTISGCSMSVTAEATVTARNDVMLSVSKSLSPATVVENERITYTITVQNYGNTPVVATDDAIITDNFDPVLSNLVVTFNGTQWKEGVNYTYNASTGAFSTNPAQITVPAAEYSQNMSGEWVIQPGVSTLVISGNINA